MKDLNTENVILKHHNFLILMLLLCFLAFSRIAFSLDIPLVLFIVITMVISLCCTREENVALMCSLAPLSACFQNRWALGVTAFIYILKIRRIRLYYFLPLLFMMVWEWSHVGRSGVNIYSFFQNFTELFALSVILADKNVDYSDGFPIRFYSYMTVVGSIINYVALVKLYSFSISSLKRFGVENTNTEIFQGLLNANTQSFMCVIAISGLLLLHFYKNYRKTDKIIIYILVTIILMTQSKSALICLLIVYLSYFIFSSNKLSIKMIGGYVAGILIFVIYAVVFLDEIIKAIITRFFLEDITTGRIGLALFYYQHLVSTSDNWLYGIGLFSYTKQIERIYGDTGFLFPGTIKLVDNQLTYLPVHNNVQEVLVVWGVIGIFLCVFLFYIMFKHSIRIIPKVNCVPFFVMLIYGLQGQFLSHGIVLLALLYALVCLEYSPPLSLVDVEKNDD